MTGPDNPEDQATTDHVDPAAGQADAADLGLVQRMAKGERAALAALYERHAATVHALAQQLCGRDSAELVVQGVFLRLWNTAAAQSPRRA